jgi:hypothetical protein
MAQQEAREVYLDLICAFSNFDLDACSAQCGDTTTGNLWIRIL